MTAERTRIVIYCTVALVILIVIALGRPPETETVVSEKPVLEAEDTVIAELEPPSPTYAGIVGKNTSFFDLMLGCGMSPQEIHEIKKVSNPHYDFRRIYPGQSYQIFADSGGAFDSLTFSINEEDYIEVVRCDNAFAAERKSYPFEIEYRAASGIIKHSLFNSLQEQGLPLELGAKLCDIFAWDIDFFVELRKNDYYRVIYEAKTRFDGLKKIGRIITAEFNTQGESHYAFLFENEERFSDYFDEKGRSLRKQLLKAPLSYTRISSSFSRRRYHPVLHHFAPHLGIDYAAPVGTPVMSTGDGTVIKASRTRANGNYVKVRHNQNYITYYMHLSRFAKGIRQGSKVKQGQVIGYVGSTGYTTGPHLDYRVKKNGRFVNPRRIKLPPAKPVSEENLVRFIELRDKWLVELHGIPIEDWRTEHFAEAVPPPESVKGANR